jgi:uncharacterized RDD family membrane protein YckC
MTDVNPPGSTPTAGAPFVAATHPTAAGVDPRSGLSYASVGSRLGAYLVDLIIAFVAFIAVGIASAVVGVVSDGLGAIVSGLGFVAWLAATVLMLIVGEGGRLGQTPGKHLLGIKVVCQLPGPIGYGRATLRYVGRIVDSIVFGLPIGLFWGLIDPQRRTWHDLIADTRVVVADPGERSLSYWLANVRR